MNRESFEAQDVRLGHLRLHIAHPIERSRAGVLLYPTIAGLNDTVRMTAQAFAGKGMCAVAWDPYDGEDGTGNPMEMVARSMRCEDRSMLHDLELVVDYMKDELRLATVGGLGWCFGGRMALMHAGSDHRIQAVSAYNPTVWLDETIEFAGRSFSRSDFPGQTLDDLALTGAITGAVQLCHPEFDFTPPSVYQQLMDALRPRPEPTIYEFYPGASHGFSQASGPANEKARRYAWASTLSLFDVALLV